MVVFHDFPFVLHIVIYVTLLLWTNGMPSTFCFRLSCSDTSRSRPLYVSEFNKGWAGYNHLLRFLSWLQCLFNIVLSCKWFYPRYSVLLVNMKYPYLSPPRWRKVRLYSLFFHLYCTLTHSPFLVRTTTRYYGCLCPRSLLTVLKLVQLLFCLQFYVHRL